MTKLFIAALFIFAFALTVSAGSRSLLMAQSRAETTPAPPAGSEPTMAAPGTAQSQPAPADVKPGSAAPAPAPSKSPSPRQPHKDYAEMDIKECNGCHNGEGVAPNHGPFWENEHRITASKSTANCADCHNQQFCLDCHTGGGIDPKLDISNYRSNYVPRSHRTDFREIHPIKALDNPQTCTRCHQAKFCSECHSKFRGEDLMVQSHRRAWSDLKTGSPGPAHATFTTAQCQTCHPGGLLPTHVWSADHAREARRNLQACQVCHSGGDVCMTCHSARKGLMVNPHPRNWNSVKDKYRSKGNGRSCIKCHDTF